MHTEESWLLFLVAKNTLSIQNRWLNLLYCFCWVQILRKSLNEIKITFSRWNNFTRAINTYINLYLYFVFQQLCSIEFSFSLNRLNRLKDFPLNTRAEGKLSDPYFIAQSVTILSNIKAMCGARKFCCFKVHN